MHREGIALSHGIYIAPTYLTVYHIRWSSSSSTQLSRVRVIKEFINYNNLPAIVYYFPWHITVSYYDILVYILLAYNR